MAKFSRNVAKFSRTFPGSGTPLNVFGPIRIIVMLGCVRMHFSAIEGVWMLPEFFGVFGFFGMMLLVMLEIWFPRVLLFMFVLIQILECLLLIVIILGPLRVKRLTTLGKGLCSL